MKNYYELLEVSQCASQEVIEKAYKTLAKKYHPDLQDTVNKKDTEQKMKEINEAYEIISNPERRDVYNKDLEEFNKIKQAKFENYNEEEIKQTYNDKELYNQLNNTAVQEQQIQNDYIIQQQLEFELEKQRAIEKAYYDAYIQDLKNHGYRIKYKKTFKEHVKNLITILIFFLMLLIIFQIPFVKNYFINLYNENEIIKCIVDFFINILKLE